jgi:hypothetical protein
MPVGPEYKARKLAAVITGTAMAAEGWQVAPGTGAELTARKLRATSRDRAR